MSSSGRAQAKQETRDALIQAGLAAFAAEGLDAPSLDAICARAGFTRGAFYVHFKDRDDFLVAVMEHVLGGFLDAVIATGDEANDLGHTLDRFTGALASAARPTGGRGRAASPLLGPVQLFRLIEAAARSPAIRGRLVAIIDEAIGRVEGAARSGQTRGTVRHDVEPRVGAQLLVVAALGLMGAIELGVPLDLPALRGAVARLLGASEGEA
ncbi:MAG: TetR family transcriptional regulator [bacterium]|nr:TetR family transcriptional regulator [bacterium]